MTKQTTHMKPPTNKQRIFCSRETVLELSVEKHLVWNPALNFEADPLQESLLQHQRKTKKCIKGNNSKARILAFCNKGTLKALTTNVRKAAPLQQQFCSSGRAAGVQLLVFSCFSISIISCCRVFIIVSCIRLIRLIFMFSEMNLCFVYTTAT